MKTLWTELINDLGSAALYWQLLVAGCSLLLAWVVNLVVQRYIMSRAPQEWKVGIGGIRRVLYPLSALVFVMLGRVVLQHWQHTALLKLMFFLLLAMAAIRLSVYALRFVFSPSAWLKTAENGIVTMVSIFLVLHFAGVLPEIVQALDARPRTQG